MIFYLLVAGAAGWGLLRTLRTQARARKYLEEARDESPLRVEHLSAPLQALARETRALRVSLEGPLHQLELYTELANFDASELDALLTHASRELSDWMRNISALREDDLMRVRELGAEPEKVRARFEKEGEHLDQGRGRMHLRDRLWRISKELEALESRLQSQVDPYR